MGQVRAPLAATQAAAEPPPSAAVDSPPLALSGIVKSWRGLSVLDGIDLALEPGSVTWLGGRNGAGKTTLLRIAAALILPDRGTTRVAGIDPERDRRSYQSRLGYLPAGNGGLYARLTVAGNLNFWAGMALLDRSRRLAAVDRALRRFGIEELRDRRVDRLSMGQRQRVRLAATLLHDPQVVLLDEPHASLDDDGLGLLRSVFEELTLAGGAALWCSPSRIGSDLRRDFEYVLEGGKVVAA
jgi:ABC-type multidrug transport system ATPase subunit